MPSQSKTGATTKPLHATLNGCRGGGMKYRWISILLGMALALCNPANAVLELTVDLSANAAACSPPLPGDLIEVTVEIAADGSEVIAPFVSVLMQLEWDPAALTVANAGGAFLAGNATQGPQFITQNGGTPLSGSPTQPCAERAP